jgi:copper homeostasis protein
MASRILLEAAVSSVEDAIAATRAGADRVELCIDLAVGGLTPPISLLRMVRLATRLPIMAMVRPRPGGFVFAEGELAPIPGSSADGFVVGALTLSAEVNVPAMADFLRQAGRREVVFHRAFDEVADPFAALEQLVALGVRRILTSGQRPTAMEGAGLIRELIERAAGRIEILPGAGVRSDNVAELVRLTGCTQVHGTFRHPTTGLLDPGELRRVRETLDGLA